MNLRNLTHLKYVLDALELGGLAPSAERNRVAVSTISQAVRQVEDALGVSVLEHARNAFVPTPAAQRLLTLGRELLARAAALEDSVRTASQEALPSPVRIGVSRSLSERFLPPVIAAVRAAEPGARFELVVAKTAELDTLLERGGVDLVVGLYGAAPPRSKAVVLRKGRFVICAADDAQQEAYLTTEGRPEVAALHAWHKQIHGRALPVVLVAESWDVIAGHARLGLGAALLPDFFLEGEKRLKRVGVDFGLHSYAVAVRQKAGSRWLRIIRQATETRASGPSRPGKS